MIAHNSRDAHFRVPLGAQACGTRLTLSILCDEHPRAVTLRLWWDDRERKIQMPHEEGDIYSAQLTLPDHPGLLWYHFILTFEGGRTLFYGNAHDRMGGLGAVYNHEPPGYQLTVYDKNYDPPHWLRDGVMYHIMVDRFHASRPVAERPAPDHGHWHQDWHEAPELCLDPKTSDNLADDFFGGDIQGIRQKLPYLKGMGVSVLYLSPVFRARSNHKYNTGDHMRIDPSFGDEQDFFELCEAARAMGIRVMLDGVFSHTGSDSRYFNREGGYDSVGAYQSRQSPYSSWYSFRHWPDQYESWWGFDTLPCVNEMDEGYLRYMILGDDAVSVYWLRAGASGWRLDVADELPMDFMRLLRERLKRENAQNALLGEVWENASCKMAYDELRCYCLGDTLDSCMNYPLREMLFDFLLGRATAGEFARRMEHMQEVYPLPFLYSLMNLMGSHDKARAVNVLSGAFDMEPPRSRRSARQLGKRDYERGKKRMLLCWQFINALPGMPSLYYADEAGAQGMADPFCRGTYPWGREDKGLLSDMRRIMQTRNANPVWARGALKLYAPCPDVLVCVRWIEGRKDVFGEQAGNALGVCAINRSDKPVEFELPPDELLAGGLKLRLKGLSPAVL